MKTINPVSLSLLVALILASCNLPGNIVSQTQTANQNPAGTIVAMTVQGIPTSTQIIGFIVTNIAPTKTAWPMSTRTPPNIPVWSAYNYTCELATGGGDMTMHLGWTDRSNSEEGYKVYRDGSVIATLASNSTFYVDVAFVATGNSLSYSVEAFNMDWQVMSDTITYGCQ